jgi:hypothetical protein
MAKDVKCEVQNCNYWGQGNSCSAESIYVVTHSQKASNFEETDCRTFKSK